MLNSGEGEYSRSRVSPNYGFATRLLLRTAFAVKTPVGRVNERYGDLSPPIIVKLRQLSRFHGRK